MNYETITQTVEVYDDDAGEYKATEASMQFTQSGLGKHGTFVFDIYPDAHEAELIDRYEANWALACWFKDMDAQVSDWYRFGRYVNEHNEEPMVQEAMDFLQGCSGYSSAWELPLVNRFNRWLKRIERSTATC